MDDLGQLYTLEGVAAALIMLVTIYIVLNATSVYTAGDTHIPDMQLEALGSDALVIMDTAPNGTAVSPLQGIIEVLDSDNRTRFNSTFLSYINAAGSGPTHNIQYNATYTCRIRNPVAGDPPTMSCGISATRNLTGGEHTVRATRWVLANYTESYPADNCYFRCGGTDPQTVLVEVLLWRD